MKSGVGGGGGGGGDGDDCDGDSSVCKIEKYLVHNIPRTVKMSSPTFPECRKVFSRYEVLQRHRRTKHPVKNI